MGSKSRVVTNTNGALNSSDTNAKLDYIARAIAELADFVDDLENQLRRIEAKQR
jgi:hypothetical protein